MLQLVTQSNEIFTGKIIRFSDGATSIVVPELPDDTTRVTITIKDIPVDSYYTVVTQLMINVPMDVKVELNLPYLPYARADRCFGDGYANPLADFLEFLYDGGIRTLYLTDPHNKEAVASYYNGKVHYVDIDVSQYVPSIEKYVIVAPDKGAINRAAEVAKRYGNDIIFCEKVRNPHNGYITGLEVLNPEKVAGKHLLIVDDICDGGATFNIAAEALRKLGASTVSLYVTHGIFSKGIEALELDNVYFYQRITPCR